jgi:hypothetical protein
MSWQSHSIIPTGILYSLFCIVQYFVTINVGLYFLIICFQLKSLRATEYVIATHCFRSVRNDKEREVFVLYQKQKVWTIGFPSLIPAGPMAYYSDVLDRFLKKYVSHLYPGQNINNPPLPDERPLKWIPIRDCILVRGVIPNAGRY